MFSAGSLNSQAGDSIGGVTSHAEIGKDCAKCHPAPWESDTLGDRCMRCHKDIVAQLSDQSSMHSMLMKNEILTCRSCHAEHRGQTAPLTNISSKSFPHNTTGYSLNSHNTRKDGQPFVCSDCHGEDVSRFDITSCSNCHQQMDSKFMFPHVKAYGVECLACHDGLDTLNKNFDHSHVQFKLEGKHLGLECEKCHFNISKAIDFKTASTECVACHLDKDAHKGEFGKECGNCHQSAGWKPATFDHSLSAFKLEGKHVDAKCVDCHANNVFKGTPSACFSCHQKDDEHAGNFGQDCGACHKAVGWKPATFDHSLSNFNLDGAHVNVECNQCHKNNIFKGTPIECALCHNDPEYHAGMFPGQACSQCHTAIAWRPASYDGPHTFPINHGEKNNTCADCHQPSLRQWTCYTCHDRGEIASKHLEENISKFEDCLRCHPTGGKEGGGD